MPERVVTVVGVGRSVATPDVAVLVLGVETRASTPAEALDSCAARTQLVLEAVRGLVTEPGAVQTGQLTVEPEFDHSKAARKLLGYEAQTKIRVRVRAVGDAGRVASAALEAAGESGVVHHLGLLVDAPERAEFEARDRAFADAFARAEQYAGLAGLALGRLVDLSEVPRRDRPDTTLMASFAQRTFAASMPVEAGDLEVRAQVIATWELVD